LLPKLIIFMLFFKISALFQAKLLISINLLSSSVRMCLTLSKLRLSRFSLFLIFYQIQFI
jgi:hypothetical protein